MIIANEYDLVVFAEIKKEIIKVGGDLRFHQGARQYYRRWRA
jgi:hypothetical protein